MEESPVKHKQTSKVIDSLHGEIDKLRTELESIRLSKDEYKKKCLVLARKNDLFVDQLANAKHENDMINALLKRKERRIADLEDQYNDLSSSNEALQLNTKNLKIRCENLQESSASSTAEYERLRIAYDALIASQVEYKRHYLQEFTQLLSQFEVFKANCKEHYTALSSTLEKNDQDIDALIDGLANKRKTMDNLYVTKNKAALEHLRRLAVAAKAHGEDSKELLLENIDTVRKLMAKYPDLQIKLNEHEDCSVNLEELLGDTADASNLSFEDDSSDSAKTLTRANTMSKRKRNNRNSIRFESKSSSSDFESLDLQLPSQRQANKPAPLQQSNRLNSNSTRMRNVTPPFGGKQDAENKPSRQNSIKMNKNNKGKRRSMYGVPGKSNSRQTSVNLSEKSLG